MTIPRRKPYFEKYFLGFNAFFNKHPEIINRLENDLETKLGIKNPLVVSSGRIGLYLVLKYSGLKKGSEILIPAYTFGTLTAFIKKAGFTPKPVDINPDTFQMEPESVKKSITSKTSAILATHIFGEPCDILSIKEIAEHNKLFLIEDCAESLGARVNALPTGSFGEVAISSFDIAKPLHGIRGGLIFGKNKKIITQIRKFIDKQPSPKFPVREVARAIIGFIVSQSPVWPVFMYLFSFEKLRNSFVSLYRSTDKKSAINYKIPNILAQIVSVNLINFESRIKMRRRIFGLYKKYLGNSVKFQKTYPKSTGNKYMIVVKTKASPIFIRRQLAIKGIDIALKEEIADDCLKRNGSVSEAVFSQTIALPIYESLTEHDIKRIAIHLKNTLHNAPPAYLNKNS